MQTVKDIWARVVQGEEREWREERKRKGDNM